MAANIVTILARIARGDENTKTVKAALDHAPGCNTLSFEDWQAMHKAADDGEDQMAEVAKDLLPKYIVKWLDVGTPSSYEEWTRSVVSGEKTSLTYSHKGKCPECDGLDRCIFTKEGYYVCRLGHIGKVDEG